jgi:hypothetical protein
MRVRVRLEPRPRVCYRAALRRVRSRAIGLRIGSLGSERTNALCVVALIAVVVGASGCGGASSGMTRAQFEAGLQAICKKATKERPDADGVSVKPAERALTALRALTPPGDTGVSQATWRATIDIQLRDFQAVSAFYAKETPALLRSFKRSNPVPKLPPGTGPTAATLAQAFNSPAGRHYLRAQAALFKSFDHHQQRFNAVMRRAGVSTSSSSCKAVTN